MSLWNLCHSICDYIVKYDYKNIDNGNKELLESDKTYNNYFVFLFTFLEIVPMVNVAFKPL